MKTSLWKIVTVVAAVLLTPIAASAGSVYQDCSPCADVCNPCDMVCGPKTSLWEYGGWIDAGIYANEYGQRNAYNAGGWDPVSGNTALLQNTRLSDFQANQTWLYFGKKLSKRGWDVGGRIDAAYGTDMLYTQSRGLEIDVTTGAQWGTGDYLWSLPQMYAEVGYNNVSFKVGKFISTFGYESIMSPDRFFYSMCYAYGMRPATQTGAIMTWDVSRNFSVYGGWTNGADQTFANDQDNAFLGGFDWKYNNRLHVGYSVMVGTDTSGFANRDYWIQSLYADVKLTKRMNYVFEWTVNNSSQGGWNSGAYGINNELFYKLNKRWTVGLRAEWAHTYGLFNFHGFLLPPDDVFAITLAANWKPTNWLTVKPEIRYDVIDTARPFNLTKSGFASPQDSQFSGGVSVVVHY